MTFSRTRYASLFVTFAVALLLCATSANAQVQLGLTVSGGKAPDEIGWELTNTSSGVVYSCQGTGGPLQGDSKISVPAGTYDLRGWDAAGDGWNGGSLTVTDLASGSVLAQVSMSATKGGGSTNKCPGPTKGGTLLASITVVIPCNKPTITSQPASRSACAGSPTTFTVGNNMLDGTYEWQKDGITIATTKTNSYTVPVVTTASAGLYSVILRENCDPKATQVTSSTAMLTVADVPTITVQPVATKSICETFTDVLSVTATGTALTYQWRFNGVNIAGATSSSYTISNAQAVHQGNYDCVVSGQCTPSVLSKATAVTVNIRPKALTEPQDVFACPGSKASLVFAASGQSLVYQWYRNNVAVPGGNAATLDFSSIDKTANGLYYCIATSALPNPNNCIATIRSRTATVGVIDAPVITTQPTGADACTGSALSLVAEFKGSGLSYSWTRNGVPVANSNSNTLYIGNVTSADAGTYSVRATGACGLFASSNDVVIAVISKPTLTLNPISQNVVTGGEINLSVNATDWRAIQWYKDSKPIKGATSPTYTINNAAAYHSGYYHAVVSNNCGGVVSATARVIVANPVTLAPELTVSTTPVSVGEIPFGYSSQAYTIERVISNTGNAPLEITNVSVAPSQYSIIAVPAAAFTVQPNQSVSVSIRVTPTALGVVNGILTIQSNDSKNPTASVSLTATSVIRYTHSATEGFGEVGVDQTANRCITITNRWNNDIVLDQSSITGTDATLFTLKTPAPITIAAGASSDICIDFAPTTIGNKSATLSIKSMNGGDATIALDGTGKQLTGIVDAVASGISIAPNPMTDVVSVRFTEAVPTLNISVMNMAGQTLATLSATSVSAGESVQWNGTATNGASVANGMYILIIRMGNTITSVPVSVVR